MSTFDNNDQRCFSCGQATCAVSIDYSDGNTTYSYGLVNARCPNRPSDEICRIQFRSKDAGEITSVTKFFWTSKYSHISESAPSENEFNVESVVRAFMAAVNRQYGTLYNQYIPSPANAQAERGYDCEIASSKGNYDLKIQVTRALPQDIYQDQAKRYKKGVFPTRQLSNKTIDQAADWIMKAILRKASRASHDIVLVIDGQDAPFLDFLTDAIVLKANEVELQQQVWHSIWVIGPTGARRLSGKNLP